MSEANLSESDSYLLEFQEAPYEQLCGCVSIEAPSALDWVWDSDNEAHQKAWTEKLLRAAQGTNRRMVEANCPKCHGLGLLSDNDKAHGAPTKDED